MIKAIRGATTVEEDNKEEIINKTQELIEKIITTNNIKKENIVYIFFTMTKDLKSEFPAVAARKIGFNDIPLMCAQELDIDGSLRKCIRIMMLIETNQNVEIKHVYLHNAVKLREDLMR
ncbi:chorismate mutase [Caldicellulosiruptoraceae bacterium PP1]